MSVGDIFDEWIDIQKRRKEACQVRYDEIFDEKNPSEEQDMLKFRMDLTNNYIEETQKYKERILKALGTKSFQ